MNVIILVVSLLAPSLTFAKSFEDVIKGFSDTLIISPVSYKSLPVNAYWGRPGGSGGAAIICKLAGYKLPLDYETEKYSGKYWTLAPIGDSFTFDIDKEDNREVLRSVTCAR